MSNYVRMKAELNENPDGVIFWRAKRCRLATGINQVVKKSGASALTVQKGVREIKAGQVYHPGGADTQRRKGEEETELLYSGGGGGGGEDRQSQKGIRKVRCSGPAFRWRHIAEAAKKAGGAGVAHGVVYRILKEKGFALRANKKEIEEGGNHPDSDMRNLSNINEMGHEV